MCFFKVLSDTSYTDISGSVNVARSHLGYHCVPHTSLQILLEITLFSVEARVEMRNANYLKLTNPAKSSLCYFESNDCTSEQLVWSNLAILLFPHTFITNTSSQSLQDHFKFAIKTLVYSLSPSRLCCSQGDYQFWSRVFALICLSDTDKPIHIWQGQTPCI